MELDEEKKKNEVLQSKIEEDEVMRESNTELLEKIKQLKDQLKASQAEQKNTTEFEIKGSQASHLS